MAQPDHFKNRIVMRYEGNGAKYRLESVTQDPAVAANLQAIEMDAKTSQVKVLPGPPAALAQAYHFQNNHAKQVFASFEDLTKASMTISAAPEHLAKMRDLMTVFNTARADKTIFLGRDEFTLESFDAVKNVIKLRPKLETAPLDGWDEYDKEVPLVLMKEIRVVHVAGRPVPAAPVVAPQVVQPAPVQNMTQTVVLQKDTFLSKAGNPTWKYDAWLGQELDVNSKDPLVLEQRKVIRKVGYKTLPRDIKYTNHSVALDLHYTRLSWLELKDAKLVEVGLEEALQRIFKKLTDKELEARPEVKADSKDKDSKSDKKDASEKVPPYPVTTLAIKQVVDLAKTVCYLLSQGDDSVEMERRIDDIVSIGHDILGRNLRKMDYVADHPSAEVCRTPIWYYRQEVSRKRVRED